MNRLTTNFHTRIEQNELSVKSEIESAELLSREIPKIRALNEKCANGSEHPYPVFYAGFPCKLYVIRDFSKRSNMGVEIT